MATTTVFNLNNVPLAATPPSYFVPNANGSAWPVGVTSFSLAVNTAGLPGNQMLAAWAVEFQRGAWTDTAGIAHPAGEWLERCGATGFINPNNNTYTLDCSVDPRAPVPTHVRLRVDQTPGYILPNVTLTAQ